MRPGSFRWWFEDRESGQITIAQFPTWPLFAIGLAWTVLVAAPEDGAVHDGARWAITALWLYWGGDELARGVNPWRRLLGTLVILWQLLQLLARLG